MKKIGILVFHPDLKKSRVNKALADEAMKNNITVRDEYLLYPKGDIDINKEQAFLLKYDRIVIQFPMYWYSSPSLLKKWEDCVLSYGWAYGSNGDKLKNKEILIAVSPGSKGYTANGEVGYSVTELLSPFKATSNLIQTIFIPPFITEGASYISDSDLKLQSKKYVNYLNQD